MKAEKKQAMEKQQEQEKKNPTTTSTEKVEEGLPMETSPYLNYTDVEDYKRQAYGTEGHLEPKAGLGGGSTDAPTPAGAAPANPISKEEQENKSK